jgi:hypothetical protein
MAWRATTGPETGEVRARHRPEAAAFEPEQVVSTPDFGPAATDGLEATEDRLGDFAVGFLQGTPASRRVVVAVWDRPPGRPMGLSSAKPRKTRRATLKWRPGSDLWGAQRFRVLVDGAPAGETDRSFITLAAPLDDGPHTWQVTGIDRRGQETPMPERTLRVDGSAPLLSVKISGKRKAGQPIKVRARAEDEGYGLDYVEVDWGDSSPRYRGVVTQTHRYRRGTFTLAVKAVDKARNVTRKVYTLKIKK